MKKLKNLLDFKSMKHVVLLMFIGILFVQCQKEELEQQKDKTYQLKLNYLIDNYTVTDSIPSRITVGNGYSSFAFVERSIDINNDDTTDLVITASCAALNNYLIKKSFLITEAKGGIEIAIQPTANWGMGNDTLHVISVFDAPAPIASYTTWYKVSTGKACSLSYYYDYTHHAYISDVPVAKSVDQKINLNVNSKYLGIRKKIKNNYVYGWIKFSIENNEKLELLECYFYK